MFFSRSAIHREVLSAIYSHLQLDYCNTLYGVSSQLSVASECVRNVSKAEAMAGYLPDTRNHQDIYWKMTGTISNGFAVRHAALTFTITVSVQSQGRGTSMIHTTNKISTGRRQARYLMVLLLGMLP